MGPTEQAAVVISGKVPTRIAKDDELVFSDHKQL